MDVIAEADAVLDALQQLAYEKQLPVEMVTGFTMLLQGIVEDGKEQYVLITHPDTTIATVLGHARYLAVATDRLVDPQPPPGS